MLSDWTSKGEACRVYHTERFSGVLLPLFGEGLLEATRRGFDAMNAALQTRTEAAWSDPTKSAVR